MGSKKSKAPEYATTTTDLGQFGSATAGKSGATFKPTQWQSDFVNKMQDTMSNSWDKAVNREVSADAVDNFNRQFSNDFNNNYLKGALSNNLLRGSSASDMWATAANNYANDRYNLTTQEMNNNLNLANNAMNNYSYLAGLAQALVGNAQGHSNNVSNYNMQKFQYDQANQGDMLSGGIKGAMNGASAGSSAGPWGALAGGIIGGAAGAYANR